MVGATRGFIVKPINKQAVYNGLIASGVAIALVCGLMYLSETSIDYVKQLRDSLHMLYLFGAMIALGVVISFYSTHRSVIKYLKMKLDDLY